ncbi:formylglycine-generating enzyme family protein [Carboxylicivirga linearis]|uniref:Formylglycine-generating enzyme family protein n=1 Tax=Carboxylicivirga linearis TaxID=1628157 RepID=A0ABS5JWP1_9BACT|nr:formylglycine-generating enzyme family protein [Carboxylicivirga linearis]MBS2099330.1 formylglycine-generating enzyme family protein [Carboxylicivirga linearis]
MRYLLLAFWGLLSIMVNSQSVITDNMVLIPAGEFVMGKDMESQPPFSPAHKVKVNAFYMDTCEVTNRQYLQFCKETNTALPEFWNTELFRCGDAFLDYPVVGVNWFSAMKYAEWAGKRLPTEAEWEYAARGGLIDKDYPNGNNWNKEKASQEEGAWENLIEPVGQYESNGYGLYDMGGNVWEWVADRYSDTYYAEEIYDNPQGPDKGSNRVIRGGSWHSGKMCKRVYYRKGLISNWSDFAVGFRCVKDVNGN